MSRRPLFLTVLLLVVCSSISAAPRRRAAGGPVDETALSTVEWLRRHAVPIATTEARTPLDDIRPFVAVARDARIVSLGEATHGSREFFTMKHRLLELLVREAGFTVFAIEASLPECDRINDYVHGGDGNVGELVRGMGFWTWNTDEVVDMVEWMREYNLSRGDRPAISFRGFDMQYGAVALADIAAYLAEVDPVDGAAINARYDCLRRYDPTPTYANAPASTRQQCHASVGEALSAIRQRRDAYVARSGAERYEVILRYAIVLTQAEAFHGGDSGVRELSMDENLVWQAEVRHPGEKFVLWAHNGHVAADAQQGDSMGVMLRRRYRTQMLVAGFLFDRGDLNARNPDLSGPVRHTIPTGFDGGYEQVFRLVGPPRFFVDMRNVQSADARQFLITNLPAWSIGSIFSAQLPNAFRPPIRLARAYDVAIWIETVTASRLRPR